MRAAQEDWRNEQGVGNGSERAHHDHEDGDDLRSYGFDAGNTLGEHVARLRKKLEAHPRYQTSMEKLSALEKEWAQGVRLGFRV